MALYIGNNKVTIYDGNNNPSNAIVSLLPSDYEQKTYIQGNGNAYLETNIQGHTNDVIQIKFNTTAKTSGTDWHYIIGYESGESNRFGIYHQNSGGFNLDFWKGNGSVNRKNIGGAVLNTIYDFNIANCYVDNVDTSTKKYSASTLAIFSSTSTYKILDSRATKKGKRTTRIYKCTIYKAGIKVREYIPAMRKSDNVYGLYDLVSNTFFTSSSATPFSGA